MLLSSCQNGAGKEGWGGGSWGGEEKTLGRGEGVSVGRSRSFLPRVLFCTGNGRVALIPTGKPSESPELNSAHTGLRLCSSLGSFRDMPKKNNNLLPAVFCLGFHATASAGWREKALEETEPEIRNGPYHTQERMEGAQCSHSLKLGQDPEGRTTETDPHPSTLP